MNLKIIIKKKNNENINAENNKKENLIEINENKLFVIVVI